MLFYLGFPQYENEEFWVYMDRLLQFLASLDDHGFSEEELRLTIEKGINSRVRSLFDSLCDGDLSSKSDEEAYNLFDWLNRESRKPNFSLSSFEDVIMVDVDESVMEIEDCGIIIEERLECEGERLFEKFEVETPFFEDEPYTPLEDIHTTFQNPLATPTDNEDALFEDYESESDEESIMIEDLGVKWDDEPLCEEVLIEELMYDEECFKPKCGEEIKTLEMEVDELDMSLYGELRGHERSYGDPTFDANIDDIEALFYGNGSLHLESQEKDEQNDEILNLNDEKLTLPLPISRHFPPQETCEEIPSTHYPMETPPSSPSSYFIEMEGPCLKEGMKYKARGGRNKIDKERGMKAMVCLDVSLGNMSLVEAFEEAFDLLLRALNDMDLATWNFFN